MKRAWIGVVCFGLAVVAEEPPAEKHAVLGAVSRSPSKDETKALGLGSAIAGRVNGQIVTEVEKGGPAEAAGLKTGDALLALGDNLVYSRDDVDDFLRAAAPGAEVQVRAMRAESKKEETLTVTLGAEKGAAFAGIRWDFAGPGQLDEALAAAKKEGRKVLVGISGAET
ncbi:MAG: PDZ domain-containing protein [Planctomycetes bacterium]|nr:PDZ domain-containing protein [Planctomycetota bacterium]